jgi:hypothetical protein
VRHETGGGGGGEEKEVACISVRECVVCRPPALDPMRSLSPGRCVVRGSAYDTDSSYCRPPYAPVRLCQCDSIVHEAHVHARTQDPFLDASTGQTMPSKPSKDKKQVVRAPAPLPARAGTCDVCARARVCVCVCCVTHDVCTSVYVRIG